jgi:uncharacterized coiled-coil protein SlyX
MDRDEEGACDQPGDPKKAEKRREQNRLAKKRSREKKKHDQVRNEGKAEEEKEREEVYQFARIWRYIDQQDRLISKLESHAAQQDRIISTLESQAAQREEQIRGLERQNMRLDELCGSYRKELRDYLRETNERKSGSIQDPVQVNHSEIPSQESQLNEYGDVGARRGGGRKKDPQTWFANLDASTAAAFFANHSTKT